MRPLRCLVLLLCAAGALFAEQDQYGGLTSLPCAGGARPHFYTEKIDNRWWLCTPVGNAFWEVGIYDAIPSGRIDWQGISSSKVVSEKYATAASRPGMLNWGLQAIRRLKAWGFNTLDSNAYAYITPIGRNNAWGTPGGIVPEKMPTIYARSPSANAMSNRFDWGTEPIKDLLVGVKTTLYNGWRSPIADYWDPAYGAWIDGMFKNEPVPTVNADWVVGVVLDDADWLWWARWGEDGPGVAPGAPVSTHAGWAILVTAPVQTAAYLRLNGLTKVYRDTRVYAKEDMAAYLQQKYGTIDALNTAWKAAYSTFASTGTAVTDELAGTGDGEKKTFEVTVSQANPSPYSIRVLVDGVAAGGDNGNGALIGSVTGKVDYPAGTISIALGAAPAAGARVAVDYISCGFGCGSGLLDEDGSHEWVPATSRYNLLSGGTEDLRADIDEILRRYSRQYFSTNRAKLDQYWPGILYLGPTTLEGRAPVYEGAADYVDVIRIVMPDWKQPWYQERLDFIARYGGDKPWMTWVGKRAVPDSYFASDPRGGTCLAGDFKTQEERGAWYEGAMDALLHSGSQGTQRFVGMQFWQLYDNQGECANWGLITPRDNPYDGASARVQAGVDAWGFPTGGEERDFGDFISFVKRANARWLGGSDARSWEWLPAGAAVRRGRALDY